jgi:hypothetical protein
MHRRLISAYCAATLTLLGAPSIHAAPPPAADGAAQAAPPAEPESDASVRVEQAIEAWRKGEWTEVRDLLEPLVREGDGIEDELLRESALRYLAESTLLDEGLDSDERKELARGYVTRLLEAAPDWTPPSGLHGRAFYDLVAQIRSERDAALAETCRGTLLACQADLAELEADHEDLEEKYARQDVAVRDVIKRNRGLALLPLGVGHFVNDNYALGGTFLALEVATGAAGLGLLIYRISSLGCVRTNGFAPKSLVCTMEGRDEEDLLRIQDHVERVRNAEIVMGYLFLGSIVLDIAIAQALFKPITVVDRGKMSREQLERETESESEAAGGRRKNPRKSPSAKLEIRPHPVYFPRGVGLGVSLRF